MKTYLNIAKANSIIIMLLAFVFLNISNLNAQTNLVPNSSFEQYTICPQNIAHQGPDYWYQPDKGYGGYWNVCSQIINVPNTGLGFQNARSGFAFVGMFYWNGNDRNYFQVKLTDSLKKDKSYYVEFYAVRPKEYYKLACNNVSLLLTKQAIYADTANGKQIIPANPQIYNYGNPILTDTNNWIKISAIYMAQGGEQYITLGNFKDYTQTNYIFYNPNGSYSGAVYFVDDVSVIPLDSFNLKADAGRDTTITTGDSAFIGSLTNGIDSIKWQVQGASNTIDSIHPGFWVHPTVNTCYVLTQTVNGYTSSDTVCVTVQTVPLKFINFQVQLQPTPNPSKKGNVKLDWQTANEINVSHFYVQRSTPELSGGKDFTIIHKEQAQNQTLNNYSFTDEAPNASVNYYRIVSVDRDGKTSFSEVRNIEYRTRNNELRVYPNPAKEFVTIGCENGKELMIIDNLGRVVYKEILRQTQNDATIINIKGLAKGLHIVKIITLKGEIKTEKLLVE